jgi:hypothetical protein
MIRMDEDKWKERQKKTVSLRTQRKLSKMLCHCGAAKRCLAIL